MNRVFGIWLASSLAIGLASTVSAQEYVFPGAVVDGPVVDGGFVNGGFGNTYVQQPPISGVPGNRWNMLGGPTYLDGVIYPESYLQPGTVVTQPGTVITQPRPVVVQPRTVLGRRRTYTRGYNAGPAPYRTPLPQTRLYGEGGMMAPNAYSPYNRQQTYGEAYGLGPYGTNYYSEYYQGRPLYP
ncbi:hypothetical protein [Paludisphaera borealis]|uniref:Uncharacterized protein n=1 Tax=Paludisphaera borealis TaxID=1387353 RepID=A0A1U7CQ67_9BACT|nr:hypothetical protein [Paludisphaera borealis]APW61046.1 hypothetical protein BSF38_02549 [Paludisphaera borealis]